GTAATVRLRYSGDGIGIEVADEGLAAGADGHPVPSDAAGQGGGAGLAGLSERTRLLGGQFEAGRCQQGFVVRAFLPSPPGPSGSCLPPTSPWCGQAWPS